MATTTNRWPTGKVCKCCKVHKKFYEYYVLPKGKFGLHSFCKECFKRNIYERNARKPKPPNKQMLQERVLKLEEILKQHNIPFEDLTNG